MFLACYFKSNFPAATGYSANRGFTHTAPAAGLAIAGVLPFYCASGNSLHPRFLGKILIILVLLRRFYANTSNCSCYSSTLICLISLLLLPRAVIFSQPFALPPQNQSQLRTAGVNYLSMRANFNLVEIFFARFSTSPLVNKTSASLLRWVFFFFVCLASTPGFAQLHYFPMRHKFYAQLSQIEFFFFFGLATTVTLSPSGISSPMPKSVQ